MRDEKKFVRKWRVIKLSKSQQSDIAGKFLQEAIENLENAEKLLYTVSFKVGRERGMEVKKSIGIDSLHDAVDFISMISGIPYEELESENKRQFYFKPCPIFQLTEIKMEISCKGFLEGFFSAFGLNPEVVVTCRDTCSIKIVEKE
jgi:hypothetical protein